MHAPIDPRDRGPDPYDRPTTRAVAAILAASALPAVLLHPGLRLALVAVLAAAALVRWVAGD